MIYKVVFLLSQQKTTQWIEKILQRLDIVVKDVDMKTIAERLKYAMDVLGLSEYKVAEMSGVPRPTIKNFLRGDNKPRLDTMAKIALNLGLSLDWIAFGGAEEKMFMDHDGDENLLSDKYLKRRYTDLYEVKKYLSIRLDGEQIDQILKDMISTTISDGK